MLLSELEFGSFLTYSVRGTTQAAVESQKWMRRLKDERHVGSPPVPMSRYVADRLAQRIRQDERGVELANLFAPDAVLVPVPSSRIDKPTTLWIPFLLAKGLVASGLGRACEPCLTRVEPVDKAATAPTHARPSAARHYETLRARSLLFEPAEIVLVDDVITRGATVIGAANRLRDAFPSARVRAFAAMRAISDPDDFESILDPCVGLVTLVSDGSTRRRP